MKKNILFCFGIMSALACHGSQGYDLSKLTKNYSVLVNFFPKHARNCWLYSDKKDAQEIGMRCAVVQVCNYGIIRDQYGDGGFFAVEKADDVVIQEEFAASFYPYHPAAPKFKISPPFESLEQARAYFEQLQK
jgi:hypothetical protein